MTVGKFGDLLTMDWRDDDVPAGDIPAGRICAYCGEQPGNDEICVQWTNLVTAKLGSNEWDSVHLYWHGRCAREFAIRLLGDAMMSAEIELGHPDASISAGPNIIKGPFVVHQYTEDELFGSPPASRSSDGLYTIDQLRKAWGAGAWAARRGRA